MTSLLEYKAECLEYLHGHLPQAVAAIEASGDTHQNQAKAVNRTISDHRDFLIARLPEGISESDRQQRLIVLQYCISVVSLEYRHAVWPYEYMALSRRVGELWERFCSSAWDTPSRPHLQRIPSPSFEGVLGTINENLLNATNEGQREVVASTLGDLRDIIGEINMVEDEVFSLEGVPHVIDFKSGFGSNEKGNMLRLRTVGKAYRLWNPETKLLFLVRQEQNNNYLEVIKREALWDVHCGADAYDQIDSITGSNMKYVREEIIDFETDLSEGFWSDLGSHLADLSGYLRW